MKFGLNTLRSLCAVGLLVVAPLAFISGQQIAKPAVARPNIVFILTDDHRYDFMGFTGKVPGLHTPNMNNLASGGAHVQNAFVTTALCSPSRASILTGQYAHSHTIVDNSAKLPAGLRFFPQYLQEAGYQTGFMGKWHMGNTDDAPQPGFNQWVSFQGQGTYYDPVFNVNGKREQQAKGSYTTDLLTDYALAWLNSRDKQRPFFLYLSHKAVHSEFKPAKRHEGRYKNMPVQYPPSMYLTASEADKKKNPKQKTPAAANTNDIPQWVRKQRYSWHGVDYMYHGQLKFDDFFRQYCETLLAVDESIGRVTDWLKENGLTQNTIVIYMSDNGFSFGEHGLIDKRHMYEESMRVPLLVYGPAFITANSQIKQVIQNVDIAPTILDMAGVQKPKEMQGNSFFPILKGQTIPWREKAFYEYYWEAAFPSTPTMFGVRTNQYKYIFNYGVWDANELYDLKQDPYEMNNLIRDARFQDTARSLRNQVWDWLEETGGMQIPLKRINEPRADHIYKGTF